MTYYIYDIEVFPNVFTITLKLAGSDTWWIFEISHRRNDIDLIIQMVQAIAYHNARMVGYNNIGYDYPVLHFILEQRPTAEQIYEKSCSIIGNDDRFSHIIWDRQQYAEQIDLYKIHHFDNVAKSTSLKMLEFNMRSDDIQDLPFEPGTILTDPQIDTLISYNRHDVAQTELFFNESLDMIAFRDELTAKYNRNFLNHNDTKIGKDYFVMRLEEAGISKGKTPRESIRISDIILPHIHFKKPEFQRVLDWFKAQTITETKGIFKDLACTIDGFKFDFGLGGIHGSVESQTVITDDEGVIIDLDVTSFYPSIAIVFRLFPEHLTEVFCDIYSDVKTQRMQHAKGTTENAMLKLALNGTFGDTNNKYSPFYDPQYTMSITINGQLLLCMLSDYVMDIPRLKMIQVNTDGITVKCPHDQVDFLRQICKWWEGFTGLVLEEAVYSRMFIRDVNNYLAEYQESGKLKNKGAYAYDLQWHQNHSSLVIPKAAEAALIHGVDIAEFIYNHTDKMDFLLRTKVPRSSHLLHGEERIQNISRYYISTDGEELTKVMPPLARKPDAWRHIGINKEWLTTICNKWEDSLAGINYNYYIEETKKLVNVLTVIK
jgi:hypothetical protein